MDMKDTSPSSRQTNPSALDFTYTERTDGVCVYVRPSYLPQQSRPDHQMYTWAYRVTIENQSSRRIQLMGRHWIITDGRGLVEEVQGTGVVGEQPIILPGRSFTYSSGCPLRTPTGNMRGWYLCVDLDTREKFKVRIPVFFLRRSEDLGMATLH